MLSRVGWFAGLPEKKSRGRVTRRNFLDRACFNWKGRSFITVPVVQLVRCRMVNARTGGGLSLLKGRAFSTPAGAEKIKGVASDNGLMPEES